MREITKTVLHCTGHPHHSSAIPTAYAPRLRGSISIRSNAQRVTILQINTLKSKTWCKTSGEKASWEHSSPNNRVPGITNVFYLWRWFARSLKNQFPSPARMVKLQTRCSNKYLSELSPVNRAMGKHYVAPDLVTNMHPVVRMSNPVQLQCKDKRVSERKSKVALPGMCFTMPVASPLSLEDPRLEANTEPDITLALHLSARQSHCSWWSRQEQEAWATKAARHSEMVFFLL